MNIVRKAYHKFYLNQRKICYAKIKSKILMYNNVSTIHATMQALLHGKTIINNRGKVKQLSETLRKSRINIDFSTRFIYFLDEYTIPFCMHNVIDNMPIDYELIIQNSINELIEKNYSINTNVARQNIEVLENIKSYIFRLEQKLTQKYPKELRIKNYIHVIKEMIYRPADGLHDALQRILFWNQLLWQTQHKLVGLGRLDMILHRFESEMDIDMLDDFLAELSKYYQFKSSAMLGDTGQILILGGKKDNQNYFCNAFTYAFLEVVKKSNRPDPKVLLRCSTSMPDELLNCAVDCFLNGRNGSPLFSNDDVIVPSLKELGYSDEEAMDYVTSACWEPMLNRVALGRNNCGHINFAEVFASTVDYVVNIPCEDFNVFFELYLKNLECHIINLIEKSKEIEFEEDPILNVFIKGCAEKNIDISQGGALNNDVGFLSLGLSNTVNSLLNVKEYVYEKETLSLQQVKKVIDGELGGSKGKYTAQTIFFGIDNENVLEITNQILLKTSNILKKYENKFGGVYKYGLSSPAYIQEAKESRGTFDGRLANEPYNVHISCDKGIPYTSQINFAGDLLYSGIASNGNVLDVMITSSIKQKELFYLIQAAIKKGVFQMQFNLCSYEQLMDAKRHPEKYINFIVRVWGFSAYFNDLPEEYKDVLIERARKNEMKER